LIIEGKRDVNNVERIRALRERRARRNAAGGELATASAANAAPDSATAPSEGAVADDRRANVEPIDRRRAGDDDAVVDFQQHTVPAAFAPTARPQPRNDSLSVFEFPRRAPRLPKMVWLSFLLMVALPTAVTGLYYGLIASNQYGTEFRFSVISLSPPNASQSDAAAATAAGANPGLAAFAGDFIVINYLQSKQAIIDLSKTLDIRKMFSNSKADFWARLNPEIPLEKLVNYWQGMVDPEFDVSTGIASVTVRAFTPQDSVQIATALMKQSEALVNAMVSRARLDTVKFAQRDVAQSEIRLRTASAALRHFRDLHQTADPTQTATYTLQLIMKLRGELADDETQLRSLSKELNADAPAVRLLKTQIGAITAQIAQIEKQIGSGRGKATVAGGTAADPTALSPGSLIDHEMLSTELSNFEDLQLDLQFAQKSYDQARAGLQQARYDAESQHTYLASFVQPSLPQSSQYPERLLNTAFVLIGAFVTWFVVLLLGYTVRDHLA
jgi:capsular polysaccharide transport system permease protein